MTVSQALERLAAYEKQAFAYNHASGVLYYDGATVAPQGSADVRADIDQARAYGISGVPFYVIDGRFGISGAQPAETFAQALAQAAGDRVGQR